MNNLAVFFFISTQASSKYISRTDVLSEFLQWGRFNRFVWDFGVGETGNTIRLLEPLNPILGQRVAGAYSGSVRRRRDRPWTGLSENQVRCHSRLDSGVLTPVPENRLLDIFSGFLHCVGEFGL